MSRNRSGGLGILLLLFLAGLVLPNCAIPGLDDDFSEEYKEFYADELPEESTSDSIYTIRGEPKFRGESPSRKWVVLNNSEEIHPYDPAIVRYLLKRGKDRYILLRAGKEEEYGISEIFELLDPEFVYLAKIGASGDFLGKQEITISNKLFKDREFFLYLVRQGASPPKIIREGDKVRFERGELGIPTNKNLCVMIKDESNIHLFELYSTLKDYLEDRKDFIKYLESIKAPPEKDTVDRIKEKAKQL
jgi:hypothetical protein